MADPKDMIVRLVDAIVRQLKRWFPPDAELTARRETRNRDLYELARWEQQIRADERRHALHTCTRPVGYLEDA